MNIFWPHLELMITSTSSIWTFFYFYIASILDFQIFIVEFILQIFYFARLETLVYIEAVQINNLIRLMILSILLSLHHFIIPACFKQNIVTLINIIFFISILLSWINLWMSYFILLVVLIIIIQLIFTIRMN